MFYISQVHTAAMLLLLVTGTKFGRAPIYAVYGCIEIRENR